MGLCVGHMTDPMTCHATPNPKWKPGGSGGGLMGVLLIWSTSCTVDNVKKGHSKHFFKQPKATLNYHIEGLSDLLFKNAFCCLRWVCVHLVCLAIFTSLTWWNINTSSGKRALGSSVGGEDYICLSCCLTHQNNQVRKANRILYFYFCLDSVCVRSNITCLVIV